MDLVGAEKMAEIVRRLHRATVEGGITWERVDDAAFAYTTTNSSVEVRSKDGDNMHPYQLTIVDGAGRLIDEWTTSYVAEGPDNVLVGKLYREARRRALNVAAILDGLLADLPDDPGPSDDLPSLEPPPPPPPSDDDVPF